MIVPDKLIQNRPEPPTFIAEYPMPGSNRKATIIVVVCLLIAIAGVITFLHVRKRRDKSTPNS